MRREMKSGGKMMWGNGKRMGSRRRRGGGINVDGNSEEVRKTTEKRTL